MEWAAFSKGRSRWRLKKKEKILQEREKIGKIEADGEKGKLADSVKCPEELSQAFQAMYIIHFTGFQG